MKKEDKALIFLLVFVILLISGIVFYVFAKVAYEKAELRAEAWKAKYIWFKQDEEVSYAKNKNTWACFRKIINIDSEEDIENIKAKIAVDSKYWLYINGEIVLKEGGLKRGEKPDSIYYDEIVLDDYLKEGENTIAVLVWYFGKTSYSHVSTLKPAFLFQTRIGDKTIISDSSWKAIQNPTYLKDIPIINGRLSEENIYYDARKEINNWYGEEFDDSAWSNATELGIAGDMPWGELIKRTIPFFEYSEIKEYENLGDYKGQTVDRDTVLPLKLPCNMQIVPYFKVEAKAGQKFYITLDEEYNSKGKEHKTTYIAKDGIQEFESPAWINGEKIYYFIPKDAKIIEIGYRETGYKVDEYGNFKTDDEFYNKLWKKATTTLKLNMRDTYMDCPDRERAEWWSDANIDMEQAVYSLDPNANYLYRKAVNTTIGWRYDNLLMTISPINDSNTMHLPIQMLLGVVSMHDYYLYTGDKEYLEQIYPIVKAYLYEWKVDPNGVALCENPYALWRWEDSSGNNDYVAAENAWYYYALSRFYSMAIVLNRKIDIPDVELRLSLIRNQFEEKYWRGDGYREWGNQEYDTRVNAVAVLSGIADESKYDAITNILMGDRENSPLMEKYILEALCKMGKIEEAQTRMKLQYQEMVDLEESTLCEYFDVKTGSKNHGWSGGPIIIMNKYFAGITPSNPGFKEINLKPQFGNLKNIESKVNTVSGTINVKASKNNEQIKIDLNTPVRIRVALEKTSGDPTIFINGKCVYKNGKKKFNFQGKYDYEDDEFVYFFVNEGEHFLEVK